MALHRFDFERQSDGAAFVRGVEFANDSDLTPHSPQPEGAGWAVYVHEAKEVDDPDDQPDADCPVCPCGAANA